MTIELRGVRKDYGRVRALDGVNLEIEPGQIVAILGANGAGKSTLLRCLAGVVAPDKGQIFFDGEPFLRDRLDLRRKLHFIPDFPLLFPQMDIVRHIGMMLQVYEADPSGAEQRTLELLREFNLLPLARKKLENLSRGQIYKAALTGLMVVNPELWLLDEPLASGMDPQGIHTFRGRAREAANHGRTILFTTQIIEIAERFADRVCVLQDGELRAFDTLASLHEKHSGDGGALESLLEKLRSESA